MEAAADNILQQDFLKAIKSGVKETQIIIQQLKALQKSCGKPKREVPKYYVPSEELIDAAKVYVTLIFLIIGFLAASIMC